MPGTPEASGRGPLHLAVALDGDARDGFILCRT